MSAPDDLPPPLLNCTHLAQVPGRAHGTVALQDGRNRELVFRVCSRCYLHTIANLCEDAADENEGSNRDG